MSILAIGSLVAAAVGLPLASYLADFLSRRSMAKFEIDRGVRKCEYLENGDAAKISKVLSDKFKDPETKGKPRVEIKFGDHHDESKGTVEISSDRVSSGITLTGDVKVGRDLELRSKDELPGDATIPNPREQPRHILKRDLSSGGVKGKVDDTSERANRRREPRPIPPTSGRFPIDHRAAMQVLLSLALVGSSLYVVLAEHYDPNSKHWAFGTLGTIMGFWLRGVR
jgi:hypothetical protein